MKDMAQWVCIDNRGLEKELFLNKTYREIRSEYSKIGLIVLFNEIGFVSEYYLSRFVSMQEWRQTRLEKIGL
jgi:hypothetical protein